MAVTSIAELSDLQTYLQIPSGDSTNDAVLAYLMDAAQQVIEREIGWVIPRSFTEVHNGGGREIWLRETPVLYVTSIEEGWGYWNWELNDQQVNSIPTLSLWAYSLDKPRDGLVTRRSVGNVNIPFINGRNNIRVSYVSGRHEVPAAAKLAYMELVGFWFRNSQLRAVNQAPTSFGTINDDFSRTAGLSSINLGVPTSIIEMLKGAGRRRPVIG